MKVQTDNGILELSELEDLIKEVATARIKEILDRNKSLYYDILREVVKTESEKSGAIYMIVERHMKIQIRRLLSEALEGKIEISVKGDL